MSDGDKDKAWLAMSDRELGKLVAELVTYLPAATANQGLWQNPPHGPGTLAGFKAKADEIFKLGRDIGYQEAVFDYDDQCCGHCLDGLDGYGN